MDQKFDYENIFSYAKVYVELDMSKTLLANIIVKWKYSIWTKSLIMTI